MKLLAQDLDLPAALGHGGALLSLRDLAAQMLAYDAQPPVVLPELPVTSRRAVVLERIRRKANYGFWTLASGEVTREAALAAVAEGTDLGKLIEELEVREVRIVQAALREQFASVDDPSGA